MSVDKNYLETFYEVVAYMHTNESDRVTNADGTEGRVELAIELTDKFQKTYKMDEYDGSFYDAIDEFLETELP